MRRPRMSTGAWIFTTAVTVAVIAPTAVYAAASSVVAIGDTTSTRTVAVTTQNQLLTTPIAPRQVIHGYFSSGGGCAAVYWPPAGKAVVVTSVTYDLGSGTAGTDVYGYLTSAGCTGLYDIADTTQAFETQQHAFSTGLPMPSIGVKSYSGYCAVWFTGYLIPASQLPTTATTHTPMPAHPMHRHPVTRRRRGELAFVLGTNRLR